MIKKIHLQNLLSFEDMELDLRNLNVLIGPNGSGKSNLIEALSLLQALPTDIGEPIRRGGGIDAWLRKNSTSTDYLTIDVDVDGTIGPHPRPVYHYHLCLRGISARPSIAEEALITALVDQFRLENAKGQLARFSAYAGDHAVWDVTDIDMIVTNQSALKELRDPKTYAIARNVSDLFDSVRLFRVWSAGTRAVRDFQPADQPVDFLEEDFTNLALVLQNTFINSRAEKVLNEEFSRFFERFERFGVSIFGNQVLLNMHEKDVNEPIPATRWSDGMIRYLSLLAILCHPSPPPLICIDEPDIGLHPDIMPDLARLIKSASEKTQIIITTHSKDLVDEFSDDPECVVVCERDFDGATKMQRLSSESLAEWLERYTLGQLWEKGEIGGTLY
ncbi:MAG: AAA family ATPase [Armatimonadetes bacterium]|nr:AAA family ATPase [Armatimonadota bacterium]